MKILPKLAISLLILLTPTLVCASSLTLDQCIERGLTNNPQVKAYRLAIDEAREGISEAWGSFLPTLSIDYGYTELENTGKLGRNADYLSQQSDSLQLRLSQPLFNGMASKAGLDRARQVKEYREFELQFMQKQIVREIRTSFYDILQARLLVAKWTGSVTRLQNQQQIASAWVEQELAPRLRLLEVDVELANALQQLASAEAALAISESKLKEWLAQPPDEPLVIEGSLQESSLAGCDAVESCLEQARQQRPELRLSELNIAMSREDATMIRARNLPQLSFDAGWVDYQREFDSPALAAEERNYYTLSLNLSMRPFQGGRNIFAYRRQKLAIQRLEQEQIRQNNAIVTEVRTRFQQLQEAASRLSSAAKGEAEAREAYLFAERATTLGVSSLNDLLNAELRLTRAEINKITANHALQQARVQLDYVTGN